MGKGIFKQNHQLNKQKVARGASQIENCLHNGQARVKLFLALQIDENII